MRASRFVIAGVAVLCSAVGLALYTGQLGADPKKAPKVPKYEVDATWPKPYPTAPHPVTGRQVPWITGDVAGTCIDSQDHVFILTRGNIAGLAGPEDSKGVAAPPIIEFDIEGNVVAGWGDRSVLPMASTAASSITRTTSDRGQRRRHRAEVLARRRAAAADRHERGLRQSPGEYVRQLGRQSAGQRKHDAAQPTGRHASIPIRIRSPASAAAFTSRTATATIGWRSSARTGRTCVSGAASPARSTTRSTTSRAVRRRGRRASALRGDRQRQLAYVCDRQNDRIQVFSRPARSCA
jgi:hypothetical protein